MQDEIPNKEFFEQNSFGNWNLIGWTNNTVSLFEPISMRYNNIYALCLIMISLFGPIIMRYNNINALNLIINSLLYYQNYR